MAQLVSNSFVWFSSLPGSVMKENRLMKLGLLQSLQILALSTVTRLTQPLPESRPDVNAPKPLLHLARSLGTCNLFDCLIDPQVIVFDHLGTRCSWDLFGTKRKNNPGSWSNELWHPRRRYQSGQHGNGTCSSYERSQFVGLFIPKVYVGVHVYDSDIIDYYFGIIDISKLREIQLV